MLYIVRVELDTILFGLELVLMIALHCLSGAT
jgi:hypothetical protein